MHPGWPSEQAEGRPHTLNSNIEISFTSNPLAPSAMRGLQRSGVLPPGPAGGCPAPSHQVSVDDARLFQLFLLARLHENVRPPSLLVAALPQVLSAQAAHLHPSYWSGREFDVVLWRWMLKS
ncbi:uncharacterized protein AAES06_002085 [Glossophaga mutica]